MKTIENIAQIRDLSGEPTVIYSNPVTTVIYGTPAPPCCRCCDCDCCDCNCCGNCCRPCKRRCGCFTDCD